MEEKGSDDGLTTPKRKYESSELSQPQRELLGKMYAALGECDIKPAKFRELLTAAEIPFTARSLQSWAKDFRSGSSPYQLNPQQGRHHLLSSQEERLLVGFVLARILEKTRVTVGDILGFLEKIGSTPGGDEWCRLVLNHNGFKSKRERKGAPDWSLSYDQAATLLSDWVTARFKDGVLRRPPQLLFCLDWTYTSHRTSAPKSYGLVGG